MPDSGWYPDPSGAVDTLRWWDGEAWTEHTRAAPSSTPGPAHSTHLPQPNPSEPHSGEPTAWQPRTPKGRRGSVMVIGSLVLALALIVGLWSWQHSRPTPLNTSASTQGTGALAPAPTATASGTRETPLTLPTATPASRVDPALCLAGNQRYAPGGKHQQLVYNGLRVTYPNTWTFRMDADQFPWLEDMHPYGLIRRDSSVGVVVARQPHALPSDGALSAQQSYVCWATAGPFTGAGLPRQAPPARPITTNGAPGHEVTVTGQAGNGASITTTVRSYATGNERTIILAWTENPSEEDTAAVEKVLAAVTPV